MIDKSDPFVRLPKTLQWFPGALRTNSKLPTEIWTFFALQPQLPAHPNF